VSLKGISDKEKRATLVEWMKIIYSDVQQNITDNFIFWEMQDIIKNNQALAQTPSVFFQWMGTRSCSQEILSILSA